MHELLRFEITTSDDVAAVRQLTRDVAAAAGLPTLGQTKLATASSELARRALGVGATDPVVFSLDPDGNLLRLVVTVPSGRAPGRASAGLDLRSIRALVDEFDESDAVVSVAMHLHGHPAAADVVRRVTGVRPRHSPETLHRRNLELADALTLLEAQSDALEQAHTEARAMNAELAALNTELELTNRGVLDLNTELERRAEELAASAARHEQLADQQAALANLGRLAIASRDAQLLADDVVGSLRRVLGIEACAVLRVEPGASRLEAVAADGCTLPPGGVIEPDGAYVKALPVGQAVVVDLTTGADFPFPVPAEARSAAVVAIPTPGAPWGVVVACDAAPERFTGTATAFLEAAASLLASSIARTTSENAATFAALHDRLTGLPNRAEILDELTEAIDGDRRRPLAPGPGAQVGVIFIDLDGFKHVNDTLGHAAGDAVLVETAARLAARTRTGDTLARLGGDEFVVLCRVPDASVAITIAERLLGAFDEPFLVEGQEAFLGGSAGVAMAEPGVASSDVLADADIAMYQAKQIPGSATVAFSPEMRGMAETDSRLHNELRRAEERGQLRAVYQPLVSLADGRVHGVEALLRWRHPDFGDVPAQQAVAVADRIGLSWDLTRWIAGEAAATVSGWNAANPGHRPLRLAVNFTPLLLTDPGRVAEFEAVVTAHGLPFDLLDVELTETAFADPTPETLASIAELRRRGARLAMDDFGTGYSSLIALSNLPFDVLKIDRSFVTPLDAGADTVLVTAMTGIARCRALETIAEGIETNNELVALIAAEVDLGQGYLFARPLERDALTGLAAMEADFAAIVRDARLGSVGDAEPPRDTAPVPVRPARVLVVDDNPDDLHLLEVLLGAAGHEIIGVSEPEAFLAALRDHRPDLVLMDLRMQGTSGFELVEQASTLLSMPVMAVTGYPGWVLDRDARSRRFDGVVAKPVEPERLFAQIAALLADDRART